jgi:opacity protein-like surface antigen
VLEKMGVHVIQCKRVVVAAGLLMAMVGSAAAADIYDQQAAPPTAESGFYLRGDAGWSWLDVTDDFHFDSVTAGGGVGYQWSPMFRTDLRFDHAFDYDIGGHNVGLSTATANIYLDLPLGSVVKPYIGGGLGYGFLNSDFDDGSLAAALTGGLTFDINQSVAVDIGYRFTAFFEDFEITDVKTHSVTGGLRFKF